MGSPGQVQVRDYTPDDAAAVRQLFIELQDHEHDISPDSPPGELIADAYLAWMHQRCRDEQGLIGVAHAHGEVVGFVTVLRRVERTDPDDPVPVHAYVSELSVRSTERGRGVGSALLAWAEQQARDAGRDELRIGAVAINHGARRLYERLGFEALHVIYSKQL